MDSTSPPTKPPRGVKTSKETSGLLMTVIRTLSRSESNEQRDREKAKLEREYKRSDQQLNELVSLYNGDLTHVMQLFGKMSAMISASKEKLKSVKENLLECKTLLSCRRDELKKLWLEGIEHKHVLELLEEIEELREVPAQLEVHLGHKQFLDGTKLLVSALKLGDGSLEGVEALRELKNELNLKKEKLYQKLLEELNYEVYINITRELVDDNFEGGYMKDKGKWNKVNDLDISGKEDIESSGIRIGVISNLVECLALLDKLSEAIESIKVRMQAEILGVISRISKTLVANPTDGVHPLLDLLEILKQQLKKVALTHTILLDCISFTAKAHNMNVVLFQTADVWSTIQAVLQLFLTDYLDIQNTASETQQTSPFTDHTGDISSYFARRRQQRSRKVPLFRFEYSSHAVNSSNYLKEHKISNISLVGGDSKQREKLLVCSPDPHNITIIFVPLQKFIEEIEEAMGTGSSPCTLSAFVNDYVREVFIGREHALILMKIESATKTADAWRTQTPPHVMSEMGFARPLLQSTVQVNTAVKDLESLLDTLSTHKEQILSILVGLIRGYTETCHAAYRGIVQPEPEDKRLCSAAWLKDDDISRFLKSLPNWLNLQAQKSVQRGGKSLKREDTVEEESPEDIRQRNIKEAEILASNLGEGGIGPHEIISDPMQLKCLALLQESMEWFAWRVVQIAVRVKKLQPNFTDNGPNNFSHFVSSLQKLALEFEELANTCLLVLHLEVRVQCFHYLLPKGSANEKVGGNTQDPDPRVLDLSRVLVAIDEALAWNLQSRKMKYIFEGLGHLIAKILMSSAQYMDRIDEAAIHRMGRNIYALEHTLTNITVAREIALDHARHYFQLFFLTPEEILNRVLEKGPEFSELEYMNAFQLINRTYNGEQDQSSIQRILQRLSDILGEVGVTV